MFLIGFLMTVFAYALCNALQHPNIRQSSVNATMTVVPPTIYLILAYTIDEFAIEASSESVAAIATAMGVILIANMLKAFDKTPLMCC